LIKLKGEPNKDKLSAGGEQMIRTIEATIDEQGNVRLLEPVKLTSAKRAFVTILEEAPSASVNETTVLSEPVLAKDWNRPEEDLAWSHLQPER
jgi:hypothetical protein